MAELLGAWPIGLALLVTGVFAGILAGLLGVGGGIVIVPVLYFLLQQFGVSAESAMSVATATSLATIVPTAISSIRAHHQKGNVDSDILRIWGPFIFVAAILGSVVASSLKGGALTVFFGVLAMLVSFNMLFRAGAPSVFTGLPNAMIQRGLATLVGGLSVMVGIGGGTLGVPTLSALNVSAHRAVGTAAAFGLIIALPGVLTLMVVGETPADAPIGTWNLVNVPAFLLIIPLTVLFAPVGAALGARLNQKQLKKAFAVALFITGGRMLYHVLTR